MIVKPRADDEQIEKANLKAKEISYYSRFKFLRVVNGIRLGNLNGFIGTTGSGKSTLLKTIVADTLRDCSCLVWLSEETIEEYQAKINTIVKSKSLLSNLRFIQESDIDEKYFKFQPEFHAMFKQTVMGEINNFNTKAIFIDNLTSSYLYNEDISVSQQGRSAKFLHRLAKDLGIAVVYVAHTKKNVNDTYTGLITKEDCRGSQQISIVSEYLYILQKFQSGGEHFPIVQTVKHRFHEVADKWHLLVYKDGNYLGDSRLDFNVVKRIFNSRDKL